MAKTVRVKFTLEAAAGVKTVWEKYPDFKLGDVGLNDFITLYETAERLEKDYAKQEVELSGALTRREEKSRELSDLVVRFRKGMFAHFGSDSAEYGQSGGTRESQRKRSARKAAPVASDATTSAVTSA